MLLCLSIALYHNITPWRDMYTMIFFHIIHEHISSSPPVEASVSVVCVLVLLDIQWDIQCVSFPGIQFWLSRMSCILLHSVGPSVFITASSRLSSEESSESIMVLFVTWKSPLCFAIYVFVVSCSDSLDWTQLWSQLGGYHRGFVDNFAWWLTA